MVSGEQICLSAFDRRHLEKTLAWVNDPELSRLLNRQSPVSDQEHQKWFEELQKRKDCLYFAIETIKDRTHIGNVWFWDIDSRHHKAELRILIGEPDKLGQGMGSEAISLSCSYVLQHLKLHKVYAYVLAINPRARSAFEKAGFTLEGTLKEDRWSDGHYVDVYIMGKLT